jgi:hypothetical protein
VLRLHLHHAAALHHRAAARGRSGCRRPNRCNREFDLDFAGLVELQGRRDGLAGLQRPV